MNTTQKGDTFENEIFNYLENALKNKQLGLDPEFCKIYRKKKYYSKDRKSDIIVDISLELWLKDAPNWSILWVWECKNLSHAVPVDDVEEFHSKIEQIAGDNVKGGIATKNGLQKGAINYAKSKGLAVVRVMPESQIEWIMYHMTINMFQSHGNNENDVYSALTNPNYRSKNREYYCFLDGHVYENWRNLFTP
jgi:hypothetical protein